MQAVHLRQIEADRMQDLSCYRPAQNYRVGRSKVILGLWLFCEALLVSSWLPGSSHRRFLLRLFGAKLGAAVIVKPRVRVKFPWKLKVGQHSWIGEGVWIDNLAPVTIGANSCLSQGAYLCTGSHDWSRSSFDLITKPIRIGDSVWIGARAIITPGVEVGSGAVLTAGSVATTNLEPGAIHAGLPAKLLKRRKVQANSASSSDFA